MRTMTAFASTSLREARDAGYVLVELSKYVGLRSHDLSASKE